MLCNRAKKIEIALYTDCYICYIAQLLVAVKFLLSLFNLKKTVNAN